MTDARFLGGALSLLLITGAAGCGKSANNTPDAGDPDSGVPPAELTVTPATATVELGATQVFTATASGAVSWSVTGAPAAGTIDATGTYTAPATMPAQAAVQIVAALVDDPAITTTAQVTLVEPSAASLTSLTIEPAATTVGVGTTVQLTATGGYSDGSTRDLTTQVAWSSQHEAVATIGTAATGTPGLVTTLSGGTATLAASHDGQTATATVTAVAVTLSRLDLSPLDATLAVGAEQPFTATAVYSDGHGEDVTGSAVWSLLGVTPSGALSLDAGGRVTANTAGGRATVQVSYGGQSASTAVAVAAAALERIELSPEVVLLPAGFSAQLVATGIYADGSRLDLTEQATWAPTTGAVATVSDEPGLKGWLVGGAASATPVAITATFAGRTGTSQVTVTSAPLLSIDVQPTQPQLARGTQLAFTATGVFQDGSTLDLSSQVTWTSADATCATIDGTGVAFGVLQTGTTCTTSISAVHPNATAVAGQTTLTVTNATLVSLDVSPSTPRIATGATLQFTATGAFSDGTTQDLTAQVTWTSSELAVATIDATGLATGVSAATSTTTISATSALDLAATGSTVLTVSAASLERLSISPATATIVPGQRLQLAATATYSDGTTADVTGLATWSSSDPAIATVSNAAGSAGIATGAPGCGTSDCGTTQIQAVFSGVTSAAPAVLTLNGVTLVSIAVSPDGAKLPVNYKRPFTAIGTHSDGSTVDLTAQVAWSSSNSAVATLSNATGSKGLATGVAVGAVTVTATMATPSGPVSGTAALTVTNAKLSSLSVTPASAIIVVGQKLQLGATATFNDLPATVLDVTTQVNWKYSPRQAAFATVSPGGVVTGVRATGTSTITAAKTGKTATAAITVNP